MMFPVKSRNGNRLRAKDRRLLWRARTAPPLCWFYSKLAVDEMKLEINVVFGVLVLLTGASQTGGQSSVLPPGSSTAPSPSFTGSSVSPELTEDPGTEAPQRTHNLTGRTEPSIETTTETPQSEETALVETETNSVLATDLIITSSATPTNLPVSTAADSDSASSPAAADGLSSTPAGPLTTPLPLTSTTDGTAALTSSSLATFSSQPAHTEQDASSTAATSTAQPEPEAFTTAHPPTSALGGAPAGETQQDAPSELNVGDEELKKSRYHSRSPLDPLLAGLLSVFIVTTAIVFVALFLKFRQRTNHPEFHRLQDVPMDDLMEDTPLSRYPY